MPLAAIDQPAALRLQADKEEELFDIVDDTNRVIGQEKRSVVHAQGLKHRAVYCFVFKPDGALLLQQRSPKKKIGPLQWDLSVAEHLEPGETYREAAARGLKEELGISVEVDKLAGPLLPVHLRLLEVPEVHVKDCEFVTSFRLDDWEGQVAPDPGEVHAWRFADVTSVQDDMQAHPERYTAWFRDELRAMDFFAK